MHHPYHAVPFALLLGHLLPTWFPVGSSPLARVGRLSLPNSSVGYTCFHGQDPSRQAAQLLLLP